MPTPPISSAIRDFCSSRKETPVGPQLQTDPSATTQPSLVSPRPFSKVSSPHDSLLDEGSEGEEGQFDDAEEGELCNPQRLHPSEQPLPPSPSPSPMPSPVPSQVNQLVQRILELKRSVAVSPDAVGVDVVADLPEVPLCLEERGSTDETPMDTSGQGEKPNAPQPALTTFNHQTPGEAPW